MTSVHSSIEVDIICILKPALSSRSEDLRIKKRLKRDEITKEFGEPGINFNAKLDCRLCDEKLESYSRLDQHLFSEHQQGVVLCELVSIL